MADRPRRLTVSLFPIWPESTYQQTIPHRDHEKGNSQKGSRLRKILLYFFHRVTPWGSVYSLIQCGLWSGASHWTAVVIKPIFRYSAGVPRSPMMVIIGAVFVIVMPVSDNIVDDNGHYVLSDTVRNKIYSCPAACTGDLERDTGSATALGVNALGRRSRIYFKTAVVMTA